MVTGKPGKFSEDAWGQRHNPATWSGAPDPTATDDGHADSVTPRGFTGHEMLDDLGLVHMNGRIYDPLLGRFLSADILVQHPELLQSYNRYSYVRNNPLTLTDPTGFLDYWDTKGGYFQKIDLKANLAQQKADQAAAPILLHAAKDMAIGAIPVVGTGVALKQDYDTLRGSSSVLEKVAAGVDVVVIGVTLGVENVHGEINAAKTVVKEGEALLRAEAHATENVVKNEAKEISHVPTANVEGAAPVPKPVEPELQGPGLVPDNHTVVKGGTTPPPAPGTEFSGSHGPDLPTAAAGVPHGQVQVTTAGDIRAAGGTVTLSPEPTRSGTMNNQHVNVVEAKAPTDFSPPQPNPVPKNKRVGEPGYEGP